MNNITYKEILKEKGMYIATPIGKSMYPMLRSRIDTVKLITPATIKKYDVILYKRNNGQYVLHRIIKIKNNEYILSGDNQWQKEYGITKNMIIGVMDGYYRKERYVSNKNIYYRVYVHIWTKTKIIKRIIYLVKRFLYKLLKRKHTK